VSEATAEACVCGHSLAAHRGGSGSLSTPTSQSPSPNAHASHLTPCGFCHCAEFRDPRYVITPPKHLSEKAVQALNILAHAPTFHGVPEAALINLADQGERHLLMAGTTLIEQGAAADALFLIVRGRVGIEQRADGHRTVLGEMGPGEVVGEMGLLDGSPRHATVVAREDVEVVRISAELVKATFKEIPATLMAVVRLVNERLGRHRGGPGAG